MLNISITLLMHSVGILLDGLGYLPYKVTWASQTMKREYLVPSSWVCISSVQVNTRPQKQNPMCYMFFLSWEVGREGQRGDQQLSRHQLHCMLFLRRNLDRQFANSKPSLLFWPWWHSQQVWSMLHPAQKRFWGTPIVTAQIHRWQERREIKNQNN